MNKATELIERLIEATEAGRLTWRRVQSVVPPSGRFPSGGEKNRYVSQSDTAFVYVLAGPALGPFRVEIRQDVGEGRTASVLHVDGMAVQEPLQRLYDAIGGQDRPIFQQVMDDIAAVGREKA